MALGVALAAFVLGFFSATYFAMRLVDIAAVNDHIEDIKQIEGIAVTYWLGEFGEEKERDAAAHRLRGKLHAAALFRSNFRNVIAKRFQEYVDLEGKLFDAATGGDFQTDAFKPDPKAAGLVMVTCNEMRALLRGVRKQLYWAH